MSEMQTIREICEKGHAARKKAGIKVRQPLASLTCSLPLSDLSDPLVQLIKDELNVKKVIFEKTKTKEISVKLDTQLSDDLILEGKAREIIRKIQNLRKKAGCSLDDLVIVDFEDSEENQKIIQKFRDYIKKEALVKKLQAGGEWEIVK